MMGTWISFKMASIEREREREMGFGHDLIDQKMPFLTNQKKKKKSNNVPTFFFKWTVPFPSTNSLQRRHSEDIGFPLPRAKEISLFPHTE